MTKTCSRCQQEKPLEAFPKNASKKNPDRRRSTCRSCHAVTTKAYYAADPARQHALTKAWFASNPGKQREYQDRYNERHPEKKGAASRAWILRNPERMKQHSEKRRALKMSSWVEDVIRDVVWARDEGVCRLCLAPADPESWHLEHLTPLARGGEHSYANTAVSHPACNARKHAKTLSEWNLMVGVVRA